MLHQTVVITKLTRVVQQHVPILATTIKIQVESALNFANLAASATLGTSEMIMGNASLPIIVHRQSAASMRNTSIAVLNVDEHATL